MLHSLTNTKTLKAKITVTVMAIKVKSMIIVIIFMFFQEVGKAGISTPRILKPVLSSNPQ